MNAPVVHSLRQQQQTAGATTAMMTCTMRRLLSAPTGHGTRTMAGVGAGFQLRSASRSAKALAVVRGFSIPRTDAAFQLAPFAMEIVHLEAEVGGHMSGVLLAVAQLLAEAMMFHCSAQQEPVGTMEQMQTTR